LAAIIPGDAPKKYERPGAGGPFATREESREDRMFAAIGQDRVNIPISIPGRLSANYVNRPVKIL
jgi:hypothetical protein